MTKLDARVAFVGDLHGDAGLAEVTAVSVARAGIRQMVFLGDWGMLWTGSVSEAESLDRFDAALTRHRVDAFVIGGNHENYDLWEQFPADEEGVRTVRPHVHLLPRVWRTEVEGRRVAALGGAHSIDIDSPHRRPGYGWWPQEEITEADLVDLGDAPVDVLLAHEAPKTTMLAGRLASSAHLWSARELRWAAVGHARFQRAVEATRPKVVFSGHYHQHVDTVEEFTSANGRPFTTRSVILPADGRWPFAVIFDFATLEIIWPEPGGPVSFAS